jgi:UDPglucose 6-dehydrogenase
VSRIFIVGSGTVGSATGLDLIRAGHQVTFVDDADTRVAALTEQGLDARPSLALVGEPEAFIFLCLPTPSDSHGYDLTAIQDGAVQVGRALAEADARHIVVVRSTVPPGTTRELVRPLLERHSGKQDGVGFGLAASPDFRRTSRPVPGPISQGRTEPGRTEQGLPIRGLFEERQGVSGPRMTVIGALSQRVAHRLGDLLGPLGGQVRVFDDPATAELIKCTSSLFNATKISFWNEIWGVCGQLGLDPDQIADTVASSAQGSIDPGYGLRGGAPYGGAQLPGDTGGFLGFAAELGIPMPLLSAVVGVNTAFEHRLAAELDGLSVISAIPRSRTELPDHGRPDHGLSEEELAEDGLAEAGLAPSSRSEALAEPLFGPRPFGLRIPRQRR